MTVKIDGTNTVANPAFTGADTDTGLQCGTNEVNLVTDGTARLKIDSSGNVGIGKTSSGNKLEIEGQGNTKVVIDARTDAANGSNAALELWSKNSSGTNNFGFIDYNGDGSFEIGSGGSGAGSVPLVFKTNASERMRIRSSGEVEVNEGVLWDYNTGSTDSRSWHVRNDIHAYGDFAFRRSTTQTGSTYETKILFKDTGGICFNGDTAQANALDDYEKGTWTPTITGLGNHNNIASGTWGKYTKVGNRVFITFRYSWSSRSTSNGGVVFLASLPFSAANDSYSDPVYIGGLEGIRSNSGREHYGGNVVNNTNTIQFRASGDDVSENSLFGSLSTSMSTGYIYGAANYIV